MIIKQIEKNAYNEMKRLVTDVFMEFEAPDYSEEGVKSFFHTALNNEEYLNSLVIYGACENDKLLGVIATRNEGKHIGLFFVDGKYHRQGIGRKLFNTVLENCKSDKMTVNSSPFAVGFYHRLGFKDVDKEQTVDGIRFTPMEYIKG